MKTIQRAVDQVAYELQNEAGTPQQNIVINVERGFYPAFKVKRGSLLPLLDTDIKLKIRSAGNYFPIIDQKVTPAGEYIGVDIDAANPNVELDNLRIDNFSIGTRISNGSHSPLIQRCIYSANSNAAIYAQGASNFTAVQNIITNGDFGIVARLCKNIMIAHNSIFIDGSVGKGEAAIWAQLANNYGNGITDTGKLHLLGNIVWNLVGPAMVLFQEDLELNAIVSNFNDLYRTSSYLVGIEKKAYIPDQPRERKKINSLKDWKELKIRSNPDGGILDSKSISQDPKFVQAIKNRSKQNGLYIDLELLPLSPVLGIVPSFYVDLEAAATWLPSYFDSQLLSGDILKKERVKDGTAAGANDRKTNSGFFGQDVFITPRDLALSKNCDIDPISDIISKKLDLWFPKIKDGFFYSHERKYYLYSQKAGRSIGECAVTEFILPSRIDTNRPIKVYVAGKQISDGRYIDVLGDRVILYHNDLDIVYGTEEFEIQCWIKKWSNESKGFAHQPSMYRFKIKDGKTRYFLPEDYVGKGPVVITDDMVSLGDDAALCKREFKLEFDPQYNRTEIIFSSKTNELDNAQFDIYLGENGEDPFLWNSSAATVYSLTGLAYHSGNPVMGDFACRVETGGYISQMVGFRSGENYSLSWHSRGPGLVVGDTLAVDSAPKSGEYSIQYYDHMYDPCGYTTSGNFELASDWSRYYITLGEPDAIADKVEVFDCPIVPLYLSGFFPENAAYAEIKFTNTSDVSMWIDAAQFENVLRPSPYHRKFYNHELTVEYETSDKGFYIDRRNAIAPARNLFNQGFLYIPEIPASIYDGPIESIVTTLNEVRWQEGRKYILPWARVSGKDKLRHKSVFSKKLEAKNDVIQSAHETYYPLEISLFPREAIARQGDKIGVGLQMYVNNTEGNPYFNGLYRLQLLEPKAKYPGLLYKKFFGANEQLGDFVDGALNSSGMTQFFWIPPEKSDIVYSGPVPRRPKGSGDVLSSIKLSYRANLENLGNISITNSDGKKISVEADEPITNQYLGSYSSAGTIFKLKYPPKQGSVKVILNGRSLSQSYTSPPNSDQFYVEPNRATVLLKGRVADKITIEYTPRYILIDATDPYTLMFYHDKVFGNYTGPIVVDYDCIINLQATVWFPDGRNSIKKEIALVAQSSSVSDINNLNYYSLEY